jgi:large subunit ribosomal protein L9
MQQKEKQMKLILTQEVSGLGTAGDVVDVKDGYARNFLVPRGLATAWTRGGEKQVEAIRKGRVIREVKTLAEAQQIKATLESKPVTLGAKVGKSGRLFGAITPAEVAQAVKAGGGPDVDRRKIELTAPIKSTGTHSVLVRLHPDVQATVSVAVVAG